MPFVEGCLQNNLTNYEPHFFPQNRFRIDDLDELYERYYRRIQNSYFNVYLVMQVILSFIYILILLYFSFANDDVMERHPESCEDLDKDNDTMHGRCNGVSLQKILHRKKSH